MIMYPVIGGSPYEIVLMDAGEPLALISYPRYSSLSLSLTS